MLLLMIVDRTAIPSISDVLESPGQADDAAAKPATEAWVAGSQLRVSSMFRSTVTPLKDEHLCVFDAFSTPSRSDRSIGVPDFHRHSSQQLT